MSTPHASVSSPASASHSFYARGEALAQTAHAISGHQEAYVVALLRPSADGETVDIVAFHSDNLPSPCDALDLIRGAFAEGDLTAILPHSGTA